jgi:MFS family permease
VEGPPKRVLGALALITGCSLTFQVALTRTLAAMLAYHYGFLAISLSLLGIGAAGLYVYIRPAWFARRSLEQALATWSVVYAVALVVAPIVIVRLQFNQGYQSGVGASGGFAWALAVATVVSAIPAFASGIVVALAIRGYAAWIGPVYAADLVGAGAGALLAVPLIFWFKPPVLMVGLAVVAAAASVLFGLRLPSLHRRHALTVTVTLVLFVVALNSSVVSVPRNYFESSKLAVSETWTPLSRVLGYKDGPGNGDGGAIVYDQAWAPVPALIDGKPPGWQVLSLGPQSVGFEFELGGHALIIGGGGGRDIDNALTSGIATVDVIELNAAIRDIVDHQLKSFSGAPYTMPHVHTAIGDGRAVLARRSTKYDEIHIGFTDTLSADSAQGFALTESNLYTEEAFREYFDHLTPNGILSVSRLRMLVGPEAIRVTVLALAALQARGVQQPERNVVVLRGHDLLGAEYETVLARLRPWTPSELAELVPLAAQRTGGVMFAPDGPYVADWVRLHQQGWDPFCHHYTYDVCPPTDDRPFFFNMRRPSSLLHPPANGTRNDPISILLLTLVILLGGALIAFLTPLVLVRRTLRPPSATSLAYFAAIGLGYLLVEITFIQRFELFLGFPTYSLSVVLFSLLTFTGIGAALAPKLGLTRRTLVTGLAVTVAVLVASAFGLQNLLGELITQPFVTRLLLSVALIAPIGLLLGLAMPIGLHRFQTLFPTAVPYAWAVNGLASVVASVMGVAIALFVGFRATTLAAAACYAIALIHAQYAPWSPKPQATGTADEHDRASGGAAAAAPSLVETP